MSAEIKASNDFEWLKLAIPEFYTDVLDQIRFNMAINEFILNDILCDLETDDREKVIALLKRLQDVVTPYEHYIQHNDRMIREAMFVQE